MATPKTASHARRVNAITKKLAELRARGSQRKFLPPLSETEVRAFEAEHGVSLPEQVKAFHVAVAGGEHPADVPTMLPLHETTTIGSAKLQEPFPFSAADAEALIGALRKKPRNARAPALPGPLHGALPIMDLSDAIDCVVLHGEQRGMVWQLWDEGWTPHFTLKKGAAVQLDFLAWADGIVTDALTAAPPPIKPDTRAVDLFNLDLSDLPPQLREAQQLEKLHASGNLIEQLPSWLGDLTSLRELRVGSNPIAELPTSIANLAALEVLDVSMTKLTALPDWAGKLSALRELIAAQAQLTSLPESIGELSRLECLDVRQNRLTALPPTIGSLENLRELDISMNTIAALPPSMARLTKLRVLQIRHNPLRSLPPALAELPVESLDLEGLPELDWESAVDVVSQMSQLTLLRINHALPAVPRALSRMQNLRTLRLVAVGLERVPPEVTALSRLETLSLDQNQLTTLPDAVGQMPALKTVVLFANPIAQSEVERLRTKWPHLKIEHS